MVDVESREPAPWEAFPSSKRSIARANLGSSESWPSTRTPKMKGLEELSQANEQLSTEIHHRLQLPRSPVGSTRRGAMRRRPIEAIQKR